MPVLVMGLNRGVLAVQLGLTQPEDTAAPKTCAKTSGETSDFPTPQNG